LDCQIFEFLNKDRQSKNSKTSTSTLTMANSPDYPAGYPDPYPYNNPPSNSANYPANNPSSSTQIKETFKEATTHLKHGMLNLELAGKEFLKGAVMVGKDQMAKRKKKKQQKQQGEYYQGGGYYGKAS